MGARTKVIDLDGSGAGSVHIDPAYYGGASGCTSVTNAGNDLGTAYLTYGTKKVVAGRVDAAGGAVSGKAVLYLYD